MTNFIKTPVKPSDLHHKAYFFVFHNNDILVKEESKEKVSIPLVDIDNAEQSGLQEITFLGSIGNKACYCARIYSDNFPEEYKFINLRALYGRVDDNFWMTAGYARQIHDWDINFSFCGRCGEKTIKAEKEHVRICEKCNLSSYPRISPAIITAVVKKDCILLARGVRFPDKKMFSVLAGFVEPGESLEECVKREIFEETSIKVKNIKYFKSQSWPFPDSLMIGFTAEYESGELKIDKDEIVEAGWFKKDELPVIPGSYTLAGDLINWFVAL